MNLSLRFLIEFLPFLWPTILHDTALDILRTDFEDRFGDKVDEINHYMEGSHYSSISILVVILNPPTAMIRRFEF